MQILMRAAAGGLVLTSTLLASTFAHAADVQSCIAASERGQRARSSGKFREARDAFQVCGSEACPALVRRDCAQWQADINNAIPTVVFGAKDKQGRDLFDVTITMDGEVVVTKLDGKAVPVDPGPHTFKFDVPGMAPLVEKALIKEGEKSRVLTVSFGGGDPPGPTATTQSPPRTNGGGEETSGGHTIFPWIVVGVGAATAVAGLVIFLGAPDLPANCDKGTKSCQQLPGQTKEDLAAAQDTAGKHDSEQLTGGVVMGIGGAVLLGGLVWHFLEPSASSSRTALRVTPWTSPTSSGLSLGARF